MANGTYPWSLVTYSVTVNQAMLLYDFRSVDFNLPLGILRSVVFKLTLSKAMWAFAITWRPSFVRNQPIRNKNCLWWPCLLTDLDIMSNLYRGPSIDASYQVSLHLAKWFQRRRLKCEKLRTTDTKWWQKLTLPLARWAKNHKLNKYYQPFKNI
jgi:hypothetical protein